MKLRKLSVLILGSALFAGASSASFAQQAHKDAGEKKIACTPLHANESDWTSSVGFQRLIFGKPGGFYSNVAQSNGGKTRAQVIAELNEARAKGQLEFTDSSYPMTLKQENTHTATGKSREQFNVELKQADKHGLLSLNDSADPNQGDAGQGTTGSSSTTNMAEGDFGNKSMC